MIRHFVIVIAACLTFAQFLGNAKAASLTERPEKLEIFGTIGKDSFQRSFEITAKAKITNLSLSSSDLIEEAGPAVILSSNVEVMPPTRPSLVKAGTERFIIGIKNPTRAAKYTGRITIRYKEASEPESIPLIVQVQPAPRPSLVLNIPTKIILKAKRICYAKNRNFTLHEKTGQSSVEGVSVVAQDLLTDDQAAAFPSSSLQPTVPKAVAKGGYEKGSVAFKDFNKISAGKYSGRLIIQSSNADDLDVPIEIYLKHNWPLPVMVLFFGLLLGWLLNWWDLEGKKLSDLYERIITVDRALEELPELKASTDGQTIKGLIVAANWRLKQHNLSGAEEAVKQAEQKVDDWLRTHPQGVQTALLAGAPQAPGANAGMLLRAQAWLGSKYPGHLKVLRNAVPLILVILAAYVGYETVYQSNDTFGSSKDYFGLFGWGFGVELTRSKLIEVFKRK